MNNIALHLHKGINIKPLLIFILSMAVYLFYFAGAYPGYYSRDVQFALFTLLDSEEYFKFIIPHVPLNSFFYNLYVLIFYSISRNLVALGLFQAALTSALNVYCWNTLSKYSKEKIAWTVTLLMIFSPLNGVETAWYHRSSLFAYLIFANLVWLYKFSKGVEFKRLELVLFFVNLIIIANLRMDGIIISLASALVYILKTKRGGVLKVVLFALLIFTFAINFAIIKSDDKFYFILPFVFPVQRVHQESGAKFTAGYIDVLKSISPAESERRAWLEGNDPIYDLRKVFSRDIGQKAAINFLKWSYLFLSKNIPLFLKTQTEVFLHSSLLNRRYSDELEVDRFFAFYFSGYVEYEGDEIYAKIKEKIDIAHKPYDNLPDRITNFIFRDKYYEGDFFLKNPGCFFFALFFGTFVPFFFIFLYFVIAFKRNRDVLIPLIPLIFYSIFMFLFQPRPKCYYWYWLAYIYYFVVFAIGYEIFSTRKSRKLP